MDEELKMKGNGEWRVEDGNREWGIKFIIDEPGMGNSYLNSNSRFPIPDSLLINKLSIPRFPDFLFFGRRP